MTSRFIVPAIALVSLVASSVSAQSLVLPTARHLATVATQTAPVVRTERRNDEMWVSGLLTEFAGGVLLGRGLTMTHEIACFGAGTFISCAETGANRNTLIGVGAAAIAGGFAMATYGGKRIVVSPTRTGVVGRLTF